MPKCILIVDDNAAIRKALRSFFESQSGFEVCGEAGDGAEAVQKAKELKPDLVILDLSMPVMNGLDAARALRRILPGVPLILFTAHKGVIPESEAYAAGITAVVGKGDNLNSLVEQVQNSFEHA